MARSHPRRSRRDKERELSTEKHEALAVSFEFPMH